MRLTASDEVFAVDTGGGILITFTTRRPRGRSKQDGKVLARYRNALHWLAHSPVAEPIWLSRQAVEILHFEQMAEATWIEAHLVPTFSKRVATTIFVAIADKSAVAIVDMNAKVSRRLLDCEPPASGGIRAAGMTKSSLLSSALPPVVLSYWCASCSCYRASQV